MGSCSSSMVVGQVPPGTADHPSNTAYDSAVATQSDAEAAAQQAMSRDIIVAITGVEDSGKHSLAATMACLAALPLDAKVGLCDEECTSFSGPVTMSGIQAQLHVVKVPHGQPLPEGTEAIVHCVPATEQHPFDGLYSIVDDIAHEPEAVKASGPVPHSGRSMSCISSATATPTGTGSSATPTMGDMAAYLPYIMGTGDAAGSLNNPASAGAPAPAPACAPAPAAAPACAPMPSEEAGAGAGAGVGAGVAAVVPAPPVPGQEAVRGFVSAGVHGDGTGTDPLAAGAWAGYKRRSTREYQRNNSSMSVPGTMESPSKLAASFSRQLSAGSAASSINAMARRYSRRGSSGSALVTPNSIVLDCGSSAAGAQARGRTRALSCPIAARNADGPHVQPDPSSKMTPVFRYAESLDSHFAQRRAKLRVCTGFEMRKQGSLPEDNAPIISIAVTKSDKLNKAERGYVRSQARSWGNANRCSVTMTSAATNYGCMETLTDVLRQIAIRRAATDLPNHARKPPVF